MTKDNYIVILAWMNDLGLSLVEKFVYAIIYGFSQDGDSEFSGSRQYLADWCGCSSLRTIDAALTTLVERKLITKRVKVVNNVRFCSYVADCTGRAKIAQGVVQNIPEGGAKIAHNNIVDNIDNNIEADAQARKASKKKFSFEESLVAAGATAQHVDALMEIRKEKRLTNTPKSYKQLIEAINTVCTRKGVTVDEVVAFMVVRKWGGLNSNWAALENLRSKAKRRGVTMSIDQLIEAELNANK